MPAHTPITWFDEADLRKADRPTLPEADDAGNLAAFLDMLAVAEGTPRFGTQDGYNVIVGGGTFEGYDDHPRQSIHLPRYGISSTAAGRYQFLISTWDDLAKRFGYKNFTPASQDAGAVQLIRQCKALGLVHDGKVREAIHACRAIWASLPGAGYGQREVQLEELVQTYREAGGHDADSPRHGRPDA